MLSEFWLAASRSCRSDRSQKIEAFCPSWIGANESQLPVLIHGINDEAVRVHRFEP